MEAEDSNERVDKNEEEEEEEEEEEVEEEEQQQQQQQQQNEEAENGSEAEDDDDDDESSPSTSEDESEESDSDDSDNSEEYEAIMAELRGQDVEKAKAEEDNSPENGINLFREALQSEEVKKKQAELESRMYKNEDRFNFPVDPENWTEEDLQELWADAPPEMTSTGWDPVWADEEDWDVVREEIKEGRDPPIAPFYLPYRQYYPVIPNNHFDISTPKAAIEELDRIEMFLTWVSYIFEDGSS